MHAAVKPFLSEIIPGPIGDRIGAGEPGGPRRTAETRLRFPENGRSGRLEPRWRVFLLFFPVKHCFFGFFIVFSEKTLFETTNILFFDFKHCLSRKNNEKTEKPMF